jgi:hypothetical protein
VPSTAIGVLTALVYFGGSVLVLRSFLGVKPVSILLLIGALAGCLGFVQSMRSRITELLVTNLEFVTRGHFAENLGSQPSVSSADIRWLEYREDKSGPDASIPGGLYAVLKKTGICILPDLNEQQTSEVIGKIEDKFPQFKEQWRNNSAFGEHFTSLNIANLEQN